MADCGPQGVKLLKQVSSIGRAFSPEGLRETGVDEVGADQVENGEANMFNPSILHMSSRRDSNVLDADLAHVVVPLLGCELPVRSLLEKREVDFPRVVIIASQEIARAANESDSGRSPEVNVDELGGFSRTDVLCRWRRESSTFSHDARCYGSPPGQMTLVIRPKRCRGSDNLCKIVVKGRVMFGLGEPLSTTRMT
jgi:hypothetical protein